jgi:hypothetical protein
MIVDRDDRASLQTERSSSCGRTVVIPAFHRDAEGGPNLRKGRMMDDNEEHLVGLGWLGLARADLLG